MLLCTWGLTKHIGRRILGVNDFVDLPALISWLFVKPKNGGPTLAEMAQNKVRIYRHYSGGNEGGLGYEWLSIQMPRSLSTMLDSQSLTQAL